MIEEEYVAIIKEAWYTKGVWVKIEAKDCDEMRLIRKNVLEAINKIKEING